MKWQVYLKKGRFNNRNSHLLQPLCRWRCRKRPAPSQTRARPGSGPRTCEGPRRSWYPADALQQERAGRIDYGSKLKCVPTAIRPLDSWWLSEDISPKTAKKSTLLVHVGGGNVPHLTHPNYSWSNGCPQLSAWGLYARDHNNTLCMFRRTSNEEEGEFNWKSVAALRWSMLDFLNEATLKIGPSFSLVKNVSIKERFFVFSKWRLPDWFANGPRKRRLNMVSVQLLSSHVTESTKVKGKPLQTWKQLL